MLTVVLFIIVPKGFIPEQDTDQIAVTTEAAQGTSYNKLVEYQDKVADIIRRDPNVEGLVSTVGGSAAATLGGPNLGQIVVHLKPRGDRKELATDIIAKLRPEIAKVVGMDVYMQNPPTVRIGGQVSKSLYQFSMQSPDREELYDASRRLRKALADVPGLEDLTSDLEISSPQVNVEIDRDKAAALGVTANQIENAFYDAYGPRWVSTIYAPVNEYKVLLELAPQFQGDPSALSLLYFKATPSPGQGANGAGSGGRTDRRRHRVERGRRRDRRRQPRRPASWCRSTRSRTRRRSSARRPSTITASCRRSRSRSASRLARRSATSSRR